MAPRRPPPPDDTAAGLRSGAVARLAGMPVATLRIWEQRHQAVKPATAPSGHRRYSPADVQRVLLLRQLTSQGHAISAIAAMPSPELQRLAQPAPGGSRRAAAPHLAVVGAALAARLQRPAVARQLMPSVPPLAVYPSLQQALQASQDATLLLWHAPTLPLTLPPEVAALGQARGARRLAVVYRYASAAATQALSDAGVATLREPADDPALGRWLAALLASLPANDTEPAGPTPDAAASAPAARRYDDATLTRIAGLSPTLACECPRHVAELLMQLSSFEAYSASCAHRDTADARLHAYLQQVAGASRALFESALERLARHEGLPLP
ncbi:MerR family transcriptional regulator [Ideonella sp. 4Y16]|uniref:MerR family transcriptional regulator n=1 Tax=Ideonella alba TaxID=2824118 RepID=A0A940YBC3_9BURK|nr:MerR family transcriptional regulator [Ideonella alba]MBQ0929906.1 MerR family transcriptional regulator [Ideonella alba]MBQ0942139.1 MerR family transcriptional regulator [Ideonella alba]